MMCNLLWSLWLRHLIVCRGMSRLLLATPWGMQVRRCMASSIDQPGRWWGEGKDSRRTHALAMYRYPGTRGQATFLCKSTKYVCLSLRHAISGESIMTSFLDRRNGFEISVGLDRYAVRAKILRWVRICNEIVMSRNSRKVMCIK